MESNEEYAEIVKRAADTVRIVKPYADHDKIMGELKQAEELGAVAVEWILIMCLVIMVNMM